MAGSSRPPRLPAVSVKLLWPFLRFLGTDPEAQALLLQYGLGVRQFADPNARIPHVAAVALLELQQHRTGRSGIGFEGGLLLEPSDVEPLSSAVRHCATALDAVQLATRLFPLLTEQGTLSLVLEQDKAKIVYSSLDAAEPAVVADFAMAALARLVRDVCAVSVSDSELWLRRRPDDDTRRQAELLGISVRFCQPVNALVLPSRSLASSMPLAEPRLCAAFSARAEGLLAELRQRVGVGPKVRSLMAEHLSTGSVTMGFVARRMGMSVPTLRRHLEAEGITFSRALAELRQHVAERELRETSRPIWEIARMAGFSNAATFHRAFKRNSGMSPAVYRSVLRAGTTTAPDGGHSAAS